jgi:hypothetical protein
MLKYVINVPLAELSNHTITRSMIDLRDSFAKKFETSGCAVLSAAIGFGSLELELLSDTPEEKIYAIVKSFGFSMYSLSLCEHI